MSNMRKADIEKLSSCVSILDLYRKPLCKCIERCEGKVNSHANILLNGFVLGNTSLNGMLAVIESERGCEGCAAVICRPYYELAMRLLWASREQDGWRRLILMWRKNNRAWSDEAKHFHDVGPLPQSIFDRDNDAIRQAQSDGLKDVPQMREILKEIESRDNKDGIKAKGAEQQYTALWRGMSMATHAHSCLTTEASSMLRKLGAGSAVVATHAMLRAMTIATSPDQKSRDEMLIAVCDRMDGLL